MKSRIDFEQELDALIEAGQPLPDDLQAIIAQDEALQDYVQSLRELMQAFDESNLPPVPDTLTHEVMAFIAQQDMSASSQRPSNLTQDIWQTLQDWISWFSLPPVLQRDAWPTAFASLVIVWSVFIAPQVQADKLHQMAEHPWVVTVDQYTERVYQKSDEAANRLIQFTEGLIDFTSKSQSKTEAVLPSGSTSTDMQN